MKFFLRLLGIFALLLLFLVAYLFVSNTTKRPVAEFSDAAQTVGQLGGFHYLYNWELIDNPQWHRVVVTTRLSRSSVLEGIETPQATATLADNTLVMTLTDTQLPELSDDPEAGEFVGERQVTVGQDPMTDIRLTSTGTDQQRLTIGLTRPAQFRLQAAPNDSGVLWLDILK